MYIFLDSTAWVELSQSDNVNYMTVDLLITKNSSQQLGIIFKQEFLAERYQVFKLICLSWK